MTPHCLYFNPSKLGDGTSFVVTWSTINSTDTPSIGGSFVNYGTNPRNLDNIVFAHESKFVDGGNEQASQHVHTATMEKLQGKTMYCKSIATKELDISLGY